MLFDACMGLQGKVLRISLNVQKWGEIAKREGHARLKVGRPHQISPRQSEAHQSAISSLVEAG